jgi:hypothetical protein
VNEIFDSAFENCSFLVRGTILQVDEFIFRTVMNSSFVSTGIYLNLFGTLINDISVFQNTVSSQFQFSVFVYETDSISRKTVSLFKNCNGLVVRDFFYTNSVLKKVEKGCQCDESNFQDSFIGFILQITKNGNRNYFLLHANEINIFADSLNGL